MHGLYYVEIYSLYAHLLESFILNDVEFCQKLFLHLLK